MPLLKNSGKVRTQGFESKTPLRSTQVAARFDNGIVRGLDGSVNLVRKCRLAPYADARSLAEQLEAVEPLMRVFESIGSLANALTKRRFISKGSYRHIHLLGINVPTYFRADPASVLATKHNRDYADRIVDQRHVFMAVKLVPNAADTGPIDALDSFVETMRYGGVPLSDYERDIDEVAMILERSGMSTPTHAELDIAESWWSDLQKQDSHFVPHADHLHVFGSEASALSAMSSTKACTNWPAAAGHNVLSLATVNEFELNFQPSTKSYTRWASDMFSQGAIAISLRGMIEPASITVEEMRRQHKRVIQDISQMYEAGKLARGEQEKQKDLLASISKAYEDGGFPTLHETSVLAAFNGFKDERRLLRYSCANVRMMEHRQFQALSEMQLASSVRANPFVHELPSPVVACSGITSLNRVGDKSGAMVGFDERDGQPSYIDHSAAYIGDSYPIFLCAGSTGSGKMCDLTHTIVTPTGTTTFGDVKVGDLVMGRNGNPCTVTHVTDVEIPKKAYRITFSDGHVITACSNHQWVVSDNNGRTQPREENHLRAHESRRLAHAYMSLSSTYPDDHRSSLHELLEIVEAVPGNRLHNTTAMSAALAMMDTPSTTMDDIAPTAVPGTTHITFYPTARALWDIGIRTLQQITVDGAPDGEQVMSTEEMLGAGVDLPDGHKNFSIRVAHPLQLPHADLPVPPYTLGVWLGDGSTSHEHVTHIDPLMCGEIEKDGFEVRHHPNTPKNHEIVGIRPLLDKAGVTAATTAFDMHIPMMYLRASYDQRLALLQGLMDAGGTISEAGTAELSLEHKKLVDDALSLIRSLGIAASFTEPETTATFSGEHATTGPRYRISFTTDLPVFRLPHKKACVPTQIPESKRRLYVQSIEPVEPVPMRCITVDSPDSTYLIEGCVPTHNTMVGLNLMYQWSEMGVPCIFIDPKNHIDGEGHGPIIRNMEGQIYSLDSLTESDGVFDPVRFSRTRQAAVEMATDLLMFINPFGSKAGDYEVKLSAALQYGIISKNAQCTGEALRYAFEDGQLEGVEEIFTKCEELKDSNAQFGSMYGRNPKGAALNVHDGVTLIEVGSSHLPIPEPGSPPSSLSQRIAMALVRMMVFGSSNALTGRGGVVLLDEAWVFLNAGRSEMERLGRLARSQRVFPVLMTQRVSDAVDSGLAGYISRGIILHISDEEESRAACELFKVEPTQDRLRRIRAKELLGGEEGEASQGFDYNSLKALVVTEDDPDFPGRKKRRVLRGSVGFYADLQQRFIPVENVMPKEFLLMASTNIVDIQERERVLARRAREKAQREAEATRLGGNVVDANEVFAEPTQETESIFSKHEKHQD